MSRGFLKILFGIDALVPRMLLRLIFRVACGQTRKRQRAIHARPSDGEEDDDDEEEEDEAEERVKKRDGFISGGAMDERSS